MGKVLQPLVVTSDGHTLTIPQASSIQDGYLSRDDFVLFSGGETVPVTSFNTRTGEVILLEDDVLAALGYAPLNKHGDTMTGPLTLAGNPVSALQAATKGYVDSHAAGSSQVPGIYFASDFNASGSKLKFTGTISTGTLTRLTITAASDFVVGQGVFIASAGAGGQPLVTKVDAIDATLKIITLHDAATAVSSVNVQHDDTVALQTGINTAYADPHGGKFIIEQGYYRLNKMGTAGACLTIPYNAQETPERFFEITAPIPPPQLTYYTGLPSDDGTVLQSDLISGGFIMSIVGGPGGALNNTTLYLSNLTFRTYDNPGINALDLDPGAFQLYVENICCDAGVPMLAGSQPSNGCIGIRFPAREHLSMGTCKNIYVSNYGVGVVTGEVMVHLNTSIYRCSVGVHMLPAPHLATGRYLLWNCTTMAQFDGILPISLVIDMEQWNGPQWYGTQPGHIFYDPNNLVTGKIEYVIIQSNVGTYLDASVTGMDHVSLWNLGTNSVRNLPAGLVNRLDAVDLNVRGALTLSDGITQQPVSIGAASSAETGFRVVEVPNAATVALLTNLVSYWKLDETTTTGTRLDQLGSNTLTVGGSLVASTPGKLSNAAYSSNAAGWLYHTDNASQDFSAAPGIAIAGWINIVGLGAKFQPTMLSKWTTSAINFGLFYDSTSVAFHFGLSANGAAYTECLLPFTPTFGTWYFVCGTWDGTTMSLSVNNGIPVSVPFAGPIHHDAVDMQIFGLNSAVLSDCKVDELGLWKRGLTPTEIGTLYRGGIGLSYPF
jgi:hypothetical protein